MVYIRPSRTQEVRRLIGRLISRGGLCLALVLPAFVSGCAVVNDRVNFDLSGPPTVYRDQWARRQPPVVAVQPAEAADSPLTALFVPFRVTQKITESDLIGYTQARIVWQTWLAKRLFSVIEFDADNGPFRRDRAIALAQARGADVVIGGFVTYYYAGGPDADSQIALQLEIYDTASGQMIWSMAQSALMPARVVNDYIVFATETRGPSDPMYALARTIADDMGEIIGRWAQKVDGPSFDTKGGSAPKPVRHSF